MSKHEPILEDRKRLTFEQAEGVEPLPSQLKLKELSPGIRATLWAGLLESLREATDTDAYGHMYVDAPWCTILKDYHIYHEHLLADEFSADYKDLASKLKVLCATGGYVQVFGFFQFVIRHRLCPFEFAGAVVERALRFGHAAYRVVDKTIFPIGSEAEGETTRRAFADLAATEFYGARRHLRGAADELTNGNNPGSIRESIHAVESVVRVLEPKGDFAKALAKLNGKVPIHSAMKAGFGSLYGFTSDENGIRHPLLLESKANVDETDALFMIGACAAFVSYLINKARAAGLLG
jgi:hypothetical protein